MYYSWKYHDIRPQIFYSMLPGEKTVIRAFYFKEMEEKKEQAEAIANSGMCPAMMFM